MGFCVVRSTGLGNAKAFVERNGQQVQTPALFSYMYKAKRSFNKPFVGEFANEARRNPGDMKDTMAMEDFFGYGSCDSRYDVRRHINVIFHEMIYYKLYCDQNMTVQCIRYADSLPIRQAAEYMCNDVLTHEEHNFLNLLRERYDISEDDFLQIMSGRSLHDKLIKTPASYGREQNIRLLVQMVVARYYMTPRDNEAFVKINTMIASIAKGMRGINLTQEFMQQLFQLTENAMRKFGNNFSIPQMEDYVIKNINAK